MAANNSQLVIKAAILLALVSLASAYFGTGPYEFENFHFNLCDDQGSNAVNYSMQMYRTQDRTKRVIAHRGGFTWFAGNASVSIKAYRMGTHWVLVTEWEEEVCQSLTRFPGYWKVMWEAIGQKNMTCPPPPGRYEFEEFIIHSDPITPVLPYGQYKAIYEILDEKKNVAGCLIILVDVVQKFL